jgi:hypothetical protein
VSQVRYDLNEYSAAKVNGTDTSGGFQNEHILQKVNDAQDFLFFFLIARRPHLFLKETTLTGSSSLYSLPADFYKLKRLETYDDRSPIAPISVHQRHQSSSGGTKYFYYRTAKQIRLDKNDLSDTLTLFYYSRPRRLNFGKVAAVGANSLTLAATARAEADYYNNLTVEDVTGDFSSTISDYTAARIATIFGTPSTNDYYGLVSELPEEMHPFIVRKAAMLMKAQPQSPNPPTTKEETEFNRDLIEFGKTYGDDLSEDVSAESVFLDLEPFG